MTVCVDVVFIKSLIWYAYSIKVMTRNVNEMLLQINQKGRWDMVRVVIYGEKPTDIEGLEMMLREILTENRRW